MVFKMISRHRQTRANGSLAANARLSNTAFEKVQQAGHTAGIKILLWESFCFHFDAHPVFGTLLHFSIIVTFFRPLPRPLPRPCPALFWYERDGICYFLPVRAGALVRWGRAAGKGTLETKAAFPEGPESEQLGWGVHAQAVWATHFVHYDSACSCSMRYRTGEVKRNPDVKIPMAVL